MAKAATLAAAGTLGFLAAIHPPWSFADPPVDGGNVTIWRTVTERVDRRVGGLNAREWRGRAIVRTRQRDAARNITAEYSGALERLRAAVQRRSAPSVTEALSLARVVYGVDQTRRARCESGLNPLAVEGHGPVGLLQFQPSTFASTPFGGLSIWSPYAQALAGGWMVSRGRSAEWSCRL